jgi:CDP-paratose synthetase
LKILITGASGNLGGKILTAIHELGNECAILLRTSSAIRGEMAEFKNLTIFRCSSKFEIVSCIKEFNPDLIIHAACNYGLNGESDVEISQANINFGWSIVQALDLSNLKTFVNINTALPREVSEYSKSKHLFSDICRDFSKKFPSKFKFIDVVTQAIYDESAPRSGFISHAIRECLKDGNDFRLTAGQQKRDFIHADDVVSAIKIIVLNLKNIQGEQQFELGSGTSMRVIDVVMLIHRLSNSNANLIFGAIPYRNHEPMELVANISKLSALGWAPSVKLENKLEEILFKNKNAKTFN